MITFIKKIAVLLLIQVTTYNFAFADDLSTFYKSVLPDFQKLTPEASALGQYGKYGVSGYTGVPNISVPLFTIGSGDFSMPVELCYDASGIKVEQEATYVGLGWNLIMGGSITHIVCGQNDFDTQHLLASSQCTNLDLFKLVLNPQIEYFKFPQTDAPKAGTDTEKYRILEDVTNGDRVPDIFQASFCGHNVSFVIDINKQTNTMTPRIIDYDAKKYKIKLKDDNVGFPQTIEITDDHGLNYVFIQISETGNNFADNRSYYLSKIQNAVECLVEFKYAPKAKEAYTLKSQYYETIGKRNENSSLPEGSDAIIAQYIRHNIPLPSNLWYNINKYYPDTIKTKREIVSFSYGDRSDIKGAKRIDAITVKSRIDNTTIHNVTFNYGDFKESSRSIACGGYGQYYGFTRLKLIDLSVDGKKYSFDYNETYELPNRLSKEQDFWGYYNGQENRDGFCASPEIKYDANGKLCGLETVGSANRYASVSHCGIGTLNKITYPTGGYTKFYYEVHHFDDINGKFYYPQSTTFNSRVKYIRTEACGSGYNGKGYSTTPDTREFDVDQPTKVEIASNTPCYKYNSSNSQNSTLIDYKMSFTIVGKLSDGTMFSQSYTKHYTEDEIKTSLVLPKGHYVLSSQVEWAPDPKKFIVGGNIKITFPPEYREDTSIADVSGKSVGGGLRIQKTENYDSNNALIGYTQYKYEGGKLLIPTVKRILIDLEYEAPDWTQKNCYCSIYHVSSNPAYPVICSLGSPNVGYSKLTKEHYDKNKQLLSYDVETYHNNEYKETGEMFYVNMDGLNGKMIESSTFSKDSTIMHKTTYSPYITYGNTPSMNDMILFPWARSLSKQHREDFSFIEKRYKYFLYPKYPICVLPGRIIETNYVNGTAMKPVTTTFQYNPTNYQLSDQSVTDGTNTSRTLYSYPASNTLRFMQHNLSEVDGVETYRNGTFTGGSKYIFKVHKNPQTGASFSVVEKCCSILPDAKKSKVIEMSVTSYDDYGNIRQYTKKDGTPVTIIWSYNHQLPIMEIVGCTYDEACKKATSLSSLESKASVAETTISSIHSTLMKGLPNAYVTAYTYSPWHTVSEIIQPNGNKTKYAYDSYGRLEETKDINDKTLQKYSYNYKNK